MDGILGYSGKAPADVDVRAQRLRHLWGVVGSMACRFRRPTVGMLELNGQAPASVEVGTNAEATRGGKINS